jgi:hypothetical protein
MHDKRKKKGVLFWEEMPDSSGSERFLDNRRIMYKGAEETGLSCKGIAAIHDFVEELQEE